MDGNVMLLLLLLLGVGKVTINHPSNRKKISTIKILKIAKLCLK